MTVASMFAMTTVCSARATEASGSVAAGCQRTVGRLHPGDQMKRLMIVTAALYAGLALTWPFAVQRTPRLILQLEDYAALPITADNTNNNTRAELARVNNM